MRNDITTLRFSASAGEPSIDLQQLIFLTHQLERFAQNAAGLLSPSRHGDDIDDIGDRSPVKVEFRLVTSPRAGSIVVDFQVVVEIASPILKEFEEVTSKSSWTDVLQGVGGFGAFLWLACFGGNGVLDLWRRRGRLREISELTGENERLAREVYSLASRVLELESTTVAIAKLMERATLTGVDRVEIQVRDQPSIAIIPPPPPAHVPNANESSQRYRRTLDDAVEFAVLGAERLGCAFLATDYQEMIILVLWPDNDPPAKDIDFEADLRDIEPNEAETMRDNTPNFKLDFILGKFDIFSKANMVKVANI